MTADPDAQHPDPAYMGNKPPCDFAWMPSDHGGAHACTRNQQGHATKHRCQCGAEK